MRRTSAPCRSIWGGAATRHASTATSRPDPSARNRYNVTPSTPSSGWWSAGPSPSWTSLGERLDRLGTHVITRCNLTILLEPGQEHLAAFYRDHRVELVGSLPHYQEDLVDRLRGAGVFQKSLEALRRLNRVGYGEPGSGLRLNLMYNPAGAYLPPEQGASVSYTHLTLPTNREV